MKEQLISFETAKLANSKGCNIFNNHSRSNFYNRRTRGLIYFGRTGKQTPEHLYGAPTQSLLQKWLREVHNIHISIYRNEDGFNLYSYNFDNPYKRSIKWFNTYEEALEKGLQEALKLIKK